MNFMSSVYFDFFHSAHKRAHTCTLTISFTLICPQHLPRFVDEKPIPSLKLFRLYLTCASRDESVIQCLDSALCSFSSRTSSKFTPLFTASKSIKSSRHGLPYSLLLKLIRKSRKIPLMARWCKFEAKRTNLNGTKSKHSITVVSRDTHQRFLFP